MNVERNDLLTKRYDFHRLFRLLIRTSDPAIVRHFQAEYGMFEVDEPEQPDLVVTVADFSLSPSAYGRCLGPYLLTKDGWLCASQRYKVARWRFALKGLEERPTRLLFHGGFLSSSFLTGMVEQIMQYKLAGQAVAFVHGGCAARDGASVLFPGLGHAGKTSLAIRLVRQGWQFQADDFTFVTSSGRTLCFPSRLHVSRDLRHTDPSLFQQLGFRRRLSLLAKRFVYYASLGYGDLPEGIGLGDLIPTGQIAESAQLRAVLILVASTASEVMGPYPLESADLIDRVAAINAFESRPFASTLLAAQYARSGANSAALQGQRSVLDRALLGVPGFEVMVPRSARTSSLMVDRLAQIALDLVECKDHGRCNTIEHLSA